MQAPKSAEAVEQEQEAKLKAKYGNLGAKKKLMPKVLCCSGVVKPHPQAGSTHELTICMIAGSQIL